MVSVSNVGYHCMLPVVLVMLWEIYVEELTLLRWMNEIEYVIVSDIIRISSH